MTTEEIPKAPKKRILLVEDEPHLAFNLEFNLQAEGFEVVPAATGPIALQKYAENGPFDTVILDVMLPELDGLEVLRKIREKDHQTGILMLTARASDTDKLNGLKLGVDDYMTKPFHLEELLLKVKRMAKRAEFFQSEPGEGGPQHIVKCGPFELNTEALVLNGPNGEQTLTALEADIMQAFMLQPNRVLTREHLLDTVWGVSSDVETRTVDNFILRLRKYIESDPKNPKFLKSVRGRGYCLATD